MKELLRSLYEDQLLKNGKLRRLSGDYRITYEFKITSDNKLDVKIVEQDKKPCYKATMFTKPENYGSTNDYETFKNIYSHILNVGKEKF